MYIINKIKIQKQLYLIYFITIFIPVVFIGSYLIYNSRTLLIEHYEGLAYADNIRVKSLLLDMTSNIYNKSLSLAKDPELIQLLGKEYISETEEKETLENYDGFETILARDASIRQISIYTFNKTLHNSKYIHPVTDEIRMQDWYATSTSSVTPFWKQITDQDDFGNDMISLCLHSRIFLPKQNSYAILNMTLSSNHIKNRIENSGLNTVIWLNNVDIFYRSNRTLSPEELTLSYSSDSSGYYLGTVSLENKKLIGCISPLLSSYSTDVFHIASLNNSGYAYIHKITSIYISILLLILIATSAFIYFYSHYFSSRVIALREAMHNASLGNYHIIDEYSGEDEISDAFADLNVMIQDILHKEASIYEAQIRAQILENQ